MDVYVASRDMLISILHSSDKGDSVFWADTCGEQQRRQEATQLFLF